MIRKRRARIVLNRENNFDAVRLQHQKKSTDLDKFCTFCLKKRQKKFESAFHVISECSHY